MKSRFTLFFGIFIIMALSNAVVPVLPFLAEDSFQQGAIFSAYFLGAFLSTLPGGILSDRFGQVPLLRLGLVISVASGVMLLVFPDPFLIVASRGLEGAGAGLFVAAGMSYVNSHSDHRKMSGYLMAMMNTGLVIGLIFSGWIATLMPFKYGGVLLFSGLALLPALTSYLIIDLPHRSSGTNWNLVGNFIGEFRWLWYSSIVLIGATGVISSLYPEFSAQPSDQVGLWIASMSIATIGAVLVSSRIPVSPVRAIQVSALFMGVGILLSFFTPWSFILVGAIAGVVMIAQMNFLAQARDHQGTIMGLFSTCSYLGMAILPFMAGIIASSAGYSAAFFVTALFSLSVALTIGRKSNPDSHNEKADV